MCPMYTYMSAVLEKKYFDSAEMMVIGSSLFFRMLRAAVTPEIPLPIIMIIYRQLVCSSYKINLLTDKLIGAYNKS